MNAEQLIAFLNALSFGDLGALGAKLEEAKTACAALGHDGIAATIEEARGALLAGDVRTYRRKLETSVSRLGHVKNA